ncbi:PRKG2 [Symbiodinium natans]|uniref:PRKG2 protein n=1 Tax=Symbiodinium natans TaxID=878477 RepID=A0A812RT74_9DINO|nr:PRKG2 [Symbiodinium natans]
MSIESKDRYACWVCNRAHERQDECGDSSNSGEDSDNNECVMMRRRMVEMEEEIRELTGHQGAASSVSQQPAACEASQRKPSARVSPEPPTVAESPLSPSSTLRPSRERMPTPWAEASVLAEASVQFSESVTAVTSLEVPENVPEVGNRSVRDRIATPYMAAMGSSEDRRVLLAPALSTVEEFEAQSSREQLRSSRDRMPTPHVSSEVIQETFSSGKTVRIFPAVDMEAIPASGRRRPSRERQATPFVKEEDMPPNDARTVQFSGAVSTEAIPASGRRRPSRDRQATPDVLEGDVPPNDALTVQFSGAVSTEAIPVSGRRRPSRERQATPFVKEGDVPPNDARTVQFSGAVSTEAIPVSGRRRPSRERQATPFVKEDALPPDARRVQFNSAARSEASAASAASVQFSDAVSTIENPAPELPEDVPEVGSRPVRDHITTPYASAAAALSEDRRVLLAPVVSTVEEFEVQGNETLRSSRDRMPTPHVGAEIIEETFADTAKTVRIFPAADIEAIPASGRRRPSREREVTPFIKEAVADESRVQFNDAVSTEAIPASGQRRPSREREVTPFIKEAAANEAQVQFNDTVSTEAMKSATRQWMRHMDAAHVERKLQSMDEENKCQRGCGLLARPFLLQGRVAREAVADEARVQFNDAVSTEARGQLEAAANEAQVQFNDTVSTEAMKSATRQWMRHMDAAHVERKLQSMDEENKCQRGCGLLARPFLLQGRVAREAVADEARVQFNDAVSTEAIPASGQRRPSREREVTPFIKEAAANEAQVQFNDTVSTEAMKSEADADEARVQFNDTVSTEAIGQAGLGKTVEQLAKYAVNITDALCDAVQPVSEAWPARFGCLDLLRNMIQGFTFLDLRDRGWFEIDSRSTCDTIYPIDRKVLFAPVLPVVEARDAHDEYAPSLVYTCLSIVFICMSISFDALATSSNREDLRKGFGQVETGGIAVVHRAELKKRMTMRRCGTKDVCENDGKTVRVFPVADAEAIPISGQRRPSRDRQATPFFKELRIRLPKSEEDLPEVQTVQFNEAVTEASTGSGWTVFILQLSSTRDLAALCCLWD